MQFGGKISIVCLLGQWLTRVQCNYQRTAGYAGLPLSSSDQFFEPILRIKHCLSMPSFVIYRSLESNPYCFPWSTGVCMPSFVIYRSLESNPYCLPWSTGFWHKNSNTLFTVLSPTALLSFKMEGLCCFPQKACLVRIKSISGSYGKYLGDVLPKRNRSNKWFM